MCNNFFAFVTYLIFIGFFCQITADRILLVSTLDGKLTALDENGKQLWHHEADNEGPLLSQSISKLEFSESGVRYRLIPSLDGVLFRLDSLGLHALPVSADSLIDRSFVLSDDSIAVGSKEQHVSLMDVRRGTLFYQCSGRDSCFHGKGNTFADTGVIMVRRQTSSVRALHLRSGQERWNFSVGHLELHYLPCSGAGRSADSSRPSHRESFAYIKSAAVEHCASDKESRGGSVPINEDLFPKKDVHFQFDISRGQVRTGLWTVHLKSPICKAWELRGQRLHEITVFDMWRAIVPLNTHYHKNEQSSSTPHIYFGVDKLNEQYYVQTESLDMTQSKLINLGIGRVDQSLSHWRWRSYAISSPTRTSLIYPQLEGKDSMSTLPNSVSALALREKVTAVPYPFEEGFYVIRSNVQRKRHPGGSNAENKDASLIQEDNDDDDDDYPIYIIKYIAGGGNIWQWWPQVLAFAGLTSVTFHLFVVKFIYRGGSNCNAQVATFVSIDESDRNNNSGETLHTSDSSTLKDSEGTCDAPPTLTTIMSAPARLQAMSPESNAASPPPCFVSDYQNRFVHVSCLGRGGFGVVFVSRNRMDDIEYAVKRIGVRNSASAKERILREVKALARLEHAGIVRYYQAWIETPPPGWQEEQDAILLANIGSSDMSELYGGSLSPTTGEKTTNEPCQQELAHTSSGRWSNLSTMGKADFSIESSKDFDVPFHHYTSKLSDDSFDIVFESSHTRESEATDKPKLNTRQLIATTSSELSSEPLPIDTALSIGSNSVPPLAPKLYLYIQMQLCQPASLREWLAHNTLNRNHEHMMDIFLQIVNAVDYVHECDLIHRDLKPSNIFFAADNTVRIGDFGLVTPVEDNKVYQQQLGDNSSATVAPQHVFQVGDRRHTACVGTELYMSPEQLRGLSYDAKVDMFSLGLIFLELLYPFGTYSERARVLSDARHQILPERFKRELHQEALLTKMLLSEEPSLRPTSRALLEHPLLTAAALRRHSNDMFAKNRSRNASTCSIGK